MDNDNNKDLNLSEDKNNEPQKEVQNNSQNVASNQAASTISTPNASPNKASSLLEKIKKVNKKVNLKWAIPMAILLIYNVYQYGSRQYETSQHNSTIKNLKQELHSKLIDNSEKQLTLMMKSLVWAVRSAMIRKNNDEIAQYFYEMVQEEGMQEVLLVGMDKNIEVSTNQKNEKKQFEILYPGVEINVDKITFKNEEGAFYLVAPILSLDRKVGTLFINMTSASYVDETLLEEVVVDSIGT